MWSVRIVRVVILGLMAGVGMVAVAGMGRPEVGSAYVSGYQVSCLSGTDLWCRSQATVSLDVIVNEDTNSSSEREEWIDWIDCQWAGGGWTRGVADDGILYPSGVNTMIVDVESANNAVTCDIHLIVRVPIGCGLFGCRFNDPFTEVRRRRSG